MITSGGLVLALDRLSNDTTIYPNYLGIGSGIGSPLLTDTTLGSEFDRQAVSLTNLGSPSIGTTFTAIWNSVEASGVGGIYECGLLTASTGGSLFNRAIHDPINLTDGSEYKWEYDVQVI